MLTGYFTTINELCTQLGFLADNHQTRKYKDHFYLLIHLCFSNPFPALHWSTFLQTPGPFPVIVFNNFTWTLLRFYGKALLDFTSNCYDCNVLCTEQFIKGELL